MLVLSRKPGQELLIGEQVSVYVVEVKGKQVRLGIKAPDDVPILRGELRAPPVWAPESDLTLPRTPEAQTAC